jgi:hypothetical protein
MNISKRNSTFASFSLALLTFLIATPSVLRANNLQICKQSDASGPVSGTFSFTVTGISGVINVSVGNCVTLFNIGAGNFTVVEQAVSNTVVSSIVFTGAGTLVSADLAARSATVTVIEVATPATLTFTNRSTVQGRFTGGGSIFTSTGDRVTHGFELHCSTSDTPNNLEVNVGANNFHLDTLTSVTCSIDSAGVAIITGTGTGTYNNVAGATISFTFTDAGEPGTSDFASYLIKDSNGNTVLSASGNLNKGNQQFHPQ